MEYKYTENDNFEDYASGRVLYHAGGTATFPVRLGLEIFERCISYSEKKQDIILYDCCCGGAYLLTVLGFLKIGKLQAIYGSDIDVQIINTANDNLKLLTKEGLIKRKEQIETLYSLYGKQSHKDALHSIDAMQKLIVGKDIIVKAFVRDILHSNEMSMQKEKNGKPDINMLSDMDIQYDMAMPPDIIITDVPYGNLTEWKGDFSQDESFLTKLMKRLYDICSEATILCICSDKKQKINAEGFIRLEKQGVGKRKFEIFKKQVYH